MKALGWFDELGEFWDAESLDWNGDPDPPLWAMCLVWLSITAAMWLALFMIGSWLA
jgi:hypothetical protein